MEIANHERLLIVLGMARSGTTIFTYVLCRHPRIGLFRGGREAWLLENDCLLQRDVGRIERAAALFPDARYVVLKRPWQEEHGPWMKLHMPRARYVVIVRNREDVTRSWSGSGRWAVTYRRNARRNPDAYYDKYHVHAMALPEIVGEERCRLVQYERMVRDPSAVFGELATWLGVEDLFDTTPIGKGRHWRAENAKAFPRGDWLLDGSRARSRPTK